jgi:thioester reductase-like protein
VAYVVGEFDVAALRSALASALPDYMVPVAFVALDAFPLTPNGKIDRKALPAPEGDAYAATQYEAPQGDAEQALAQVWSELLGVERIGRHDHFFQLGGHSLMAMRVIDAVRERFATTLAVRDLFTCPLLKDQARLITQDDVVEQASVQIEDEVTLEPSIRGTTGGDGWTCSPSEILLTGATGFLGTFLLSELLARTTARIHCLVRCADEAAGRERLHRSLANVGLSPEHIDARVVIVPGDLAQPRLGLSSDAFAKLAATVDSVYHNGAFVHSLHTYETLKAANVDGTRWLLQLTATGRPKHLHFISSLNALPMVDASALTGMTPHQRDRIEWDSLPHGYAQTKWVGERLLRAAAGRGLGCTIYRPAFISGHSISGASNDIDLLSNLMDACFELGCVPNLQSRMNLVPVDQMAALIVDLSRQREAVGREHDISRPDSADLGTLARAMNALDPTGLPIVDAPRWVRMCMDNPATAHAAAALTSSNTKTVSHGAPAGRSGGSLLDATYFDRYVRWRRDRHVRRLAEAADATTKTADALR